MPNAQVKLPISSLNQPNRKIKAPTLAINFINPKRAPNELEDTI